MSGFFVPAYNLPIKNTTLRIITIILLIFISILLTCFKSLLIISYRNDKADDAAIAGHYLKTKRKTVNKLMAIFEVAICVLTNGL